MIESPACQAEIAKDFRIEMAAAGDAGTQVDEIVDDFDTLVVSRDGMGRWRKS